MTPEEFKRRTKAFALRVIRLVDALSGKKTAFRLGDQLLRSGTSVGANYRAACRARSRPDFIAKLKIVEEECDESLYWMELLVEAVHVKEKRMANLYLEPISVGCWSAGVQPASLRAARMAALRGPAYRNRRLEGNEILAMVVSSLKTARTGTSNQNRTGLLANRQSSIANRQS